MIKLWVRILILIGFFSLSVIISFSLANQTFEDRVIVLGAPTLPTLSFEVAGETVNHSFGVVNEMELTSMRGTITPLPGTGPLIVNVEGNNNHIIAIGYQVFTLDGRTLLREGSAPLTEEWTVELDLRDVFGLQAEDGQETYEAGDGGSADEWQTPMREAVLRITLFTEIKSVYFYTRIIPDENLHIRELLNFTRAFHQNTFIPVARGDISRFLEFGGSPLNNGLQSVTLFSEGSQVQWGGLSPEIHGEVIWSIFETNPSYTSILATYQVTSNEQGLGGAIFNVREFFRVRFVDDEVLFQKYHRTMNQVFGGSGAVSEDVIFLGLVPREGQIKVNEEEDVVAFVQERELWVHSKERNQLALVFSFADGHQGDLRSRNDQHSVQVIHVDDYGNTTFSVYGYMNRGNHEGMVGLGVFYYNMETNSVEEKAFIYSNQGFGRSSDGIASLVHFSNQQQRVYFVTGGTLYEIDTTNNRQRIVFEGLAPEQYTFSADGNYLAWQFDGEMNSATTLALKDLRTGEVHHIFAPGGTFIRPLGFINEDLVYGFLREEDLRRDAYGRMILPAYRIEIVDSAGEVAKSYQEEAFIESIEIEGNQIVLNRLMWMNDAYRSIDQYFIIYIHEEEESEILLRNVTSDVLGSAREIALGEGTSGISPSILRPQQVVIEDPLRVALIERTMGAQLYVYALGQLQGMFTNAADALTMAETLYGVVLSSTGSYVWERGNRFLQYNTHIESFSIGEGENSLQVMERLLRDTDTSRIDFTGASLLQMLYVINRGYPVINVLEENHGVLITAFTLDTVTYMDPRTGEEYIRSFHEVSERARTSGNVFIGFIPN